MPSPKWKLVVDVGLVSSYGSMGRTWETDSVMQELGDLINAQMPDDKNSPHAGLLPGFTSLRLLLLKPNRTEREVELLDKAISLYSQYKQQSHPDELLASMICRDFMQLTLTRQENNHNSTTGTEGISFRFGARDVSSLVSSQNSQATRFQRDAIHMNEPQAAPGAQLRHENPQQQQIASQFSMYRSNLSQNHHAQAVIQQGNYAARNANLAVFNNDTGFSVSPSLHALINSPFSQAIDGQSEMMPLNISHHASASNNGG